MSVTDEQIKTFAREHAPALAAGMTELCGKVIAKGLQGILQECAAMRLRIRELEAENALLRTCGPVGLDRATP